MYIPIFNNGFKHCIVLKNNLNIVLFCYMDLSLPLILSHMFLVYALSSGIEVCK